MGMFLQCNLRPQSIETTDKTTVASCTFLSYTQGIPLVGEGGLFFQQEGCKTTPNGRYCIASWLLYESMDHSETWKHFTSDRCNFSLEWPTDTWRFFSTTRNRKQLNACKKTWVEPLIVPIEKMPTENGEAIGLKCVKGFCSWGYEEHVQLSTTMLAHSLSIWNHILTMSTGCVGSLFKQYVFQMISNVVLQTLSVFFMRTENKPAAQLWTDPYLLNRGYQQKENRSFTSPAWKNQSEKRHKQTRRYSLAVYT